MDSFVSGKDLVLNIFLLFEFFFSSFRVARKYVASDFDLVVFDPRCMMRTKCLFSMGAAAGSSLRV